MRSISNPPSISLFRGSFRKVLHLYVSPSFKFSLRRRPFPFPPAPTRSSSLPVITYWLFSLWLENFFCFGAIVKRKFWLLPYQEGDYSHLRLSMKKQPKTELLVVRMTIRLKRYFPKDFRRSFRCCSSCYSFKGYLSYRS
jgi:hypothetical protein